MKSLFISAMLFTFATASIAAQPIKKAEDPFYMEGKPVRPSCIAVFNLGAIGVPFVTALDLLACQKSVVTNKTSYVDEVGNVYFYVNNKNDNDGVYSYKVLGKTTSGLYMLQTFQSHGGDEVNDMLLFLNFEKTTLPIFSRGKLKQNKPALMVKLHGFVNGGDRCSGGIKNAKVSGNKIIINQYSYINSVNQCEGAETYVIDTTTWQKSKKGE